MGPEMSIAGCIACTSCRRGRAGRSVAGILPWNGSFAKRFLAHIYVPGVGNPA
jgi:hypothetical protein